ncbi:MAG: ECF transporter S component [Lachnospiraceae bacterium]|nr:ECF transporter S component [Lachnospiraceae bacterium]
MNHETKKLTMIGMLCAVAYVTAVVGRIPIVLFLKYDPKDIVIAIGGMLFGPFASFSVALVVALLEMFTISDNGVLGFVMNVISSSSFACTAAFVYKKKRRLSGAVIGLLCGWGCMITVMLLWNYLITPIYMGCPREEVVKLLLPAFLPFNLIKGGLNAVITMLLYKPAIQALSVCKKHMGA